MAVFSYQAYTANTSGPASGVLNGTIAADSPRHARELLRDRQLDVIAVEPIRQGLGLGWLKQIGLRPGASSATRRYEARLITFVRELSTLLAVGTPMLQALDTALLSRTHSTQSGSRERMWLRWRRAGGFDTLLMQVRDRVAAGASLSEAMGDHPSVFDPLTVRLVEVGERSGNLDAVLDKLASFKERSVTFRGRLTNAMIYPAIVLTMAVLVTLLLMTFVVPNILQPLIQSGRPLPTVTLVVKGISDAVISWWWLMGLGSLLFIVLLTLLLRSEHGQSIWHRWQLKLPGIGPVVRKQETVRVATVVHTLIGSGVAFLPAIEVAQRTVRNRVFREALGACHEAVSTGRDIAEALRQTGAFPPTVVQVFALGQQSGRMEHMLQRLADDYDKQVQQAAQRLTTLLEPAMILVLAVLIGFIAFATILPVLEAGHVL
jgi:type II secretory pathway component PulF